MLWIAHSVWICREVSLAGRCARPAASRVLTILTSLWWIVGLSVQAGYGLDVLKYTETIKAVSTAGQSGEVQRGLGYWFFYGGDKLGPWIEAAIDYTSRRWLIFVGYSDPGPRHGVGRVHPVAPPHLLRRSHRCRGAHRGRCPPV